MPRIATSLTEHGRRYLLRFLAGTLADVPLRVLVKGRDFALDPKDELGRRELATALSFDLDHRAITDLVVAWEHEVVFRHKAATLEIPAQYSASGMPERTTFDGRDVNLTLPAQD